MGTVAYKDLSTAERIFKELIWDSGVRFGELALEGAVPFPFALPVFKDVSEAVLTEMSDWFFSQLVLLVDVTAIRLVNNAHQSAYDLASLQLKIIAIESGDDSDKFKAARDAAKAALSKFVHFGP